MWWLWLPVASAQVIDAYDGRVVGNARTVGLAGAYTGIAEGAAAHFMNPAALAVRAPSWPELDWHVDAALQASGVALSRPTAVAPDGLGSSTRVQTGANLKYGRWGVGAHILRAGTALRLEPEGAVDGLQHGILGVGGGYALAEGQVVVGLLGEVAYAQVTSGPQLVSGSPMRTAPGFAAGIKMSPEEAPVSVGLMVRPAMRTGSARRAVAGVDAVRFPAEVGGGAAGWAGDRHARYLLASLDAVVTGDSQDAVSFDAAAESGEAVVSVRAGLEACVIDQLLRLRGGAYSEPARYVSDEGRLHLAAGFDVATFHVPKTFLWRVTVGADRSVEDLAWTVAIGRW